MSLNSILTQLESEQLIRAVAEPDATYIFKNVLSQQAAYQSLLTKNRRELHLCVAKTYEKLYVDRLDEIAALLAEHYAQAGDDNKAFEYAARAGHIAMRVYANAEALEFYARAIAVAQRSADATTSSGTVREVYLNRGRVFELSGNYTAALKSYEEMETLGHARGDAAMELEALIALATIRSTPTTVYDATLGQSLSDWAIKLARQVGDRAAEAKILWNLMNLCFLTLRPFDGIEYGERALEIARELGLTERTAYILNDINRLYLATGEISKARKHVTEARELWRTLNNLPMLADNYGSGAEISQYSGELDKAFADAKQAEELARSIENPWSLAYGLGTQAFVLLERGEMDEAFRAALASIEYAEQAGFAAGRAVGKSELGLAYANLGAVARGIQLVQEVLDGPAGSFETFRPLILAYLVRLLARSGQLDEAEDIARQVQQKITPAHPLVYFSAPVGLALGELAFAKKEYANTIETLEPALAKNRQKGVRFLYSDSLLLQGRACEGLGQIDRAEQIYSEARAYTESENVRRTHWQVLLGLSRLASARGSATVAQQLREEARTIVRFIADHLHDPELHSSFLNLPDVQMVLT